MSSSRRCTGDGDAPTLVSRRAIDPHLGTSIVAICVPKACPIPGMLVSCSRQKTIVVWFSCNDYISYNAHADGARCGPVVDARSFYPGAAVLLAHTFSSHSCVAAISTVVISGDWEGCVMFQDVESKTRLAHVTASHLGGVSMVTAFSSRDGEEFFAGFVLLDRMLMFFVDVLSVTTGMDKTCKLWTHYGVLLNVLPVAQAVVIGQIRKAVLHFLFSFIFPGGLVSSRRSLVVCCCDGSVSTVANDSFQLVSKLSLNSGCIKYR